MGACVLGVAFTEVGTSFVEFVWAKLRGGYTLPERLAQYSPSVMDRLKPEVLSAGLTFPPSELTYVVFKDSKLLQIYARSDAASEWRFIRSYPVLGLSGALGPKLSARDAQVPEGVYRAVFLNPNSRFHLSIRLDYPNDLDRRMAIADGRDNLGSDIMIHGTSLSSGCVAVGNKAVEDLFVLSALALPRQTRVIISPTDLRRLQDFTVQGQPAWTSELYVLLRKELSALPNGNQQTQWSAHS